MSSLYLERARNAHELSERYENEIVKILNNKPSGVSILHMYIITLLTFFLLIIILIILL
jgi:hypothetical protein